MKYDPDIEALLGSPSAPTALSLKQYILRCRAADNLIGDFVKAAQQDRTFPDAKSWRELGCYLWARGACREAVNAGRIVWMLYRASQGALDDPEKSFAGRI